MRASSSQSSPCEDLDAGAASSPAAARRLLCRRRGRQLRLRQRVVSLGRGAVDAPDRACTSAARVGHEPGLLGRPSLQDEAAVRSQNAGPG